MRGGGTEGGRGVARSRILSLAVMLVAWEAVELWRVRHAILICPVLGVKEHVVTIGHYSPL